jgi:hypothetical protein
MTRFFVKLWDSPTFTTWGSLAVRLLSVTLVLPLVLLKFAPAEVAVWQLFATLITLQMIVDFGLAPTFSRMLSYVMGGAHLQDLATMGKEGRSKRSGVVDHSALVGVFGTLRWLYTRIGLAVLLLMAVLGTWALINPMSQVEQADQAWLAWGIVLGTSVSAVWGNAYAASIQGVNQIAVMRRWEILTSLCQIATAFIVLLAGGNLLALVFANQAWAVFGAWRNRHLFFGMYPTLRTSPAEKNPLVLGALWPAAWRSGVGILMSQGLIQASGVLYSQVAKASDVATYLLALRIITMISQFSQAPFYSKLPAMGALHAQGDSAAQLSLAKKGMAMAHWLFAIGAVAVFLLAGPLLVLIGSQVQFVSQPLWCLMALAFFVERVGAMHIQLYSLTNKIIWHIANGVTGLMMLGIAWAAYGSLGLTALPLSMFVAYGCFYMIYAVWHSQKAFQFNLVGFESKTSFGPALVLITIAAISGVAALKHGL